MRRAGIEIHVSDYCNRNCKFCTFRRVKNGKKMTGETAVRVLEKYEADTVTFSGGGEPTTNPGVLSYLIDGFTADGAKCGLITNGFAVVENKLPLDWVRLSVYGPKCQKEIDNVLAANAIHKNAALFFKGMKDLEKYLFLLDIFEEVTVKTLNESPRLTDEQCVAIREMGFKCKQNALANDFPVCRYNKLTIGVEGETYPCCLCKAQGGFFGVAKCPVPCVMYNSNKQGHLVLNKFGFPV